MHDKKVKQIEEILAKIDPVKLIKIGAPLDEYAHEAQDIYERVNRWNSVEKIHQIVYDVFVTSFTGGTSYHMVNGHLELLAEFKPTKDGARAIIGPYEDYGLIASQ